MASKTHKAPDKIRNPIYQHGSVTSYDVALRAGVSQSAVSRCFKPGASVSSAMRARVMKAVQALDYTPNALARSLITRRSNLVAVLISNLTNLYYPEVLSELCQQLEKRGLRVLLFTLPHEGDVDKMIAQVWEYQVDGVVSAARLTPQQVAEFERRRIPFVLYNRTLQDKAVNAVICGNDLMAIGCVDVARHKLKLEVPAKLSVVGFDGVEPSRWLSYDLTTLRQPVQMMAKATADMLTGLIANPDAAAEKRVFSAQFVEGGTSRLGPLKR